MEGSDRWQVNTGGFLHRQRSQFADDRGVLVVSAVAMMMRMMMTMMMVMSMRMRVMRTNPRC